MSPASLAYFFDLSSFAHTALFHPDEEPWKILLKLEAYLKALPLGFKNGLISSQAYLINEELISIGEGTIVEPGAYIQGPCVIGKNCTIRHGAYLRGNVLIGDGCVVGHASEIKQAILLNGAHVSHFNYVGDSILGNQVNLGAGVKCANFKLDGTGVKVRLGLEVESTHMRKLGVILGDRSQLGCNSVTNPGTLIGKDVWCHPHMNLRGFIPSRSLIKASQKPVITQRFDL